MNNMLNIRILLCWAMIILTMTWVWSWCTLDSHHLDRISFVYIRMHWLNTLLVSGLGRSPADLFVVSMPMCVRSGPLILFHGHWSIEMSDLCTERVYYYYLPHIETLIYYRNYPEKLPDRNSIFQSWTSWYSWILSYMCTLQAVLCASKCSRSCKKR